MPGLAAVFKCTMRWCHRTVATSHLQNSGCTADSVPSGPGSSFSIPSPGTRRSAFCLCDDSRDLLAVWSLSVKAKVPRGAACGAVPSSGRPVTVWPYEARRPHCFRMRPLRLRCCDLRCPAGLSAGSSGPHGTLECPVRWAVVSTACWSRLPLLSCPGPLPSDVQPRLAWSVSS